MTIWHDIFGEVILIPNTTKRTFLYQQTSKNGRIVVINWQNEEVVKFLVIRQNSFHTNTINHLIDLKFHIILKNIAKFVSFYSYFLFSLFFPKIILSSSTVFESSCNNNPGFYFIFSIILKGIFFSFLQIFHLFLTDSSTWWNQFICKDSYIIIFIWFICLLTPFNLVRFVKLLGFSLKFSTCWISLQKFGIYFWVEKALPFSLCDSLILVLRGSNAWGGFSWG